MKAWTIVGYTFNAETLCAYCVASKFQKVPALAVAQVEVCLDGEAKFKGIDRYDESSFDSDEFPKVIFASDVEEHETCDECGEELL